MVRVTGGSSGIPTTRVGRRGTVSCGTIATPSPRTYGARDVIVDTFAMRLVRDPQSFDVVVAASMSRAITEALGDAQARTGDICGKGNTATMTQAVLRRLRA